jgi:hypothetical protein
MIGVRSGHPASPDLALSSVRRAPGDMPSRRVSDRSRPSPIASTVRGKAYAIVIVPGRRYQIASVSSTAMDTMKIHPTVPDNPFAAFAGQSTCCVRTCDAYDELRNSQCNTALYSEPRVTCSPVSSDQRRPTMIDQSRAAGIEIERSNALLTESVDLTERTHRVMDQYWRRFHDRRLVIVRDC